MYRSALDVALVPPPVVTLTSTVPDPDGEVAVHTDPELHDTDVAGLDPKLTPVAPFRSLPMIVTTVEPDDGPDAGRTELTTGTGETKV